MRLFWASALVALLAADAVPLSRVKQFPSQTAKARAETARWMAHENTWGYITTLNPSGKLVFSSCVFVHLCVTLYVCAHLYVEINTAADSIERERESVY